MPVLIQYTDFLEYYTATNLFWLGFNSYDPDLMRNMQITFGRSNDLAALMMWNPPFIMLIFLPFIFLTPDVALVAWFFLNIYLLIDGMKLCYGINNIKVPLKKSLHIIIPFLFMFVPVTFCLILGQLGIFVFWLWVRFRFYYREHRLFLAALCLFFLCIKPHIFLLAIIIVFLREIFVSHSLKLIMLFCFFSMVSLASVTLINQDIVSHWIQSSFVRDVSYYFVRPENWKSSHFIFWLSEVGGISLNHLKIIAPTMFIFSLVICAYYFVLSAPEKIKEANVSSLASVSVLSSPFFWIFDCVIFLELIIPKLCSLQYSKHNAVHVIATVVLAFSLVWSQPFGHYAFYHQLGWYPVVVLISLWLLRAKEPT